MFKIKAVNEVWKIKEFVLEKDAFCFDFFFLELDLLIFRLKFFFFSRILFLMESYYFFSR